MRVFFDTEFIDDGRTIELISIGMVREDGREYYAEAMGVRLACAPAWVRDNVIPRLTGAKTARGKIAKDIVGFCGPRPEFWGYYSAYDWVALCQIFGTMADDLPEGWPHFCRDLAHSAKLCGVRFPMDPEGAHNALADARWNLGAWRLLPDAFAGRAPLG